MVWEGQWGVMVSIFSLSLFASLCLPLSLSLSLSPSPSFILSFSLFHSLSLSLSDFAVRWNTRRHKQQRSITVTTTCMREPSTPGLVNFCIFYLNQAPIQGGSDHRNLTRFLHLPLFRIEIRLRSRVAFTQDALAHLRANDEYAYSIPNPYATLVP